MKIRIQSVPLIFGQPDPVLISMDRDQDPTCSDGFIKLFSSQTTYKHESTNSIIKWWYVISNFIHTYLKYKYNFFFISISGRIRNSRKKIGSSSMVKITFYFRFLSLPSRPWTRHIAQSVMLNWTIRELNLDIMKGYTNFINDMKNIWNSKERAYNVHFNTKNTFLYSHSVNFFSGANFPCQG